MVQATTDSDPEGIEPAKKAAKNSFFEIIEWNVCGFWRWKSEYGICAICQSHVLDLCTDCQVKVSDEELVELATNIWEDEEGNESQRQCIRDDFFVEAKQQACPIAWGTCNHNFHFHCIDQWLKTKRVCPLDNGEWEFQDRSF